uniref:RiboL-PSP-HEPN domain-containing protein n=1 Tax=Candidatus Kentrum sp. MB TaxID=2138164 RepID=A0A451B7I9_9GAMM|nr:MAG: hypothetical protein BECKMB1821G_GA0114241_100460 [Candidatus Kentron sp. MB]VFK28443.1 MAG: hypothetical protein BECKMB1821I_GA0114274_100658 [Candidatus Kentron sp. MB]VFK74255.1 MAG: hypothetical protein BECKMB1821H_GA0114242_100276 [Candidatus Kentron sp. MB]
MIQRVALRFEAVLNHLDDLFYEASSTVSSAHKNILLSYVVIKLHDQWNFRSRQIIRLSYGNSLSQMMSLLRRSWSKQKEMESSWEPAWHIPSNAIRAGRLLNIPNLSKIKDALGAVTYINDIRWTRNAIVHNMPASFRKYRAMSLDKYFIRDIAPSQLPLEINPKSGNTIYQDWCDELRSALRNVW